MRPFDLEARGTTGIGYGFITYVVVQLLAGRAPALHPLMGAAALAFAAFFVIG